MAFQDKNTSSAPRETKPVPKNFSDPNREFLRAENEDYDGYDPYSDRRECTPLFERDPWA